MKIVAFKSRLGEEIIGCVEDTESLMRDEWVTISDPLLFVPGREENTFNFYKWSFLNGKNSITIRSDYAVTLFYEPLDAVLNHYRQYIGDTVIAVPDKRIITG